MGFSYRSGGRAKGASYLATCTACRRATNKKYAAANGGLCKACATGVPRAESDHARLLDSGYQAYARERGDYDTP